jgi:hypothetical protein
LELSFVIKFSDCFNSGYIIKSNLEIIGGALYLQQQKSTSHSSTDYCILKRILPAVFSGAKNRKNEANFDGCFEKVNLYEIFYVIKIGGKNPFYREVGFFLHKSSSIDK